MADDTKRAMTLSRFQPFHLGHLKTVRQMKQDDYKEIVVCIGSPEKSQRPRDPFTCGERIEMLHSVLKDEGFDHYFIVPVWDIDDYDTWARHVERLCPKFETVYSGNPLVSYLFNAAGYKVLEQQRLTMTNFNKIPPEAIYVSGSKIRELIVADKNGEEVWKNLLPKPVYKKLIEYDGANRIKQLNAMLYSDTE